ncbi:transglycosylase SLT domain-containing protein [Klebsiella sp. BIGb0407]|uniref:transglycosylase SLT domain-containing protein n=1 Tax=Klebsiella sp. BIGb0407 TaxID=2940603 RepID=UPI002166CF54|nr:transglycosylase SLT domain-containing protein [Klebsiella sp. BIGb0407]MCS3434218.1 soluble lytic murein transglycosylase-like protein [Klebsiella sp. BIGb0407]
MRIFVGIFLYSVFSNITYAQDCFDLAGRDYQIDSDLLRAISWNESRFKQSAVGKNTDNSIDVGLMQINSQHFSTLQSLGISKEHLTQDACMNIYTGAFILSQAFHKWGVSWQSVGAYNAGFRLSEKQANRRFLYAEKIEATYKAIKEEKKKKQNLSK